MNDKNLTPVLISGVYCYEESGVAYIRLEDAARGLGFTQIANSGNEVIRWERVRKYLAELGIPTSGDGNLPEYIRENIFYRLCMKANNETAQKFQALVCDVILPTLRKTGSYSIVQSDPNLPPELALANQTLEAVNKIYRMQLSQGERLDKLEATKTLDHSQQLAIEEAKRQRVVKLLGGKTSPAYREMSRRVFMDCGHDLKLLFDVSSYRDIPIVRFDDAKAYISAWMPKPDMLNEIQQTNGQTSLFDRNCAPAGRLREGGQTAQ